MNDRDSLPSLEELDAKLKQARSQRTSPPPNGGSGLAVRMGADFAAGVIVGTGIGMLLDHWFGSRPVLLIVCLFLGAAAGFKTMLQTSRRYEESLKDNDNTTMD